MVTLKDVLERIREERGWTRAEMAKVLGINRATYQAFIGGRNRAGRKVLGGVARAFPEVNVGYYAAADVAQADRMAGEAANRPPERCDGAVKYSATHRANSGPQEAQFDERSGGGSGRRSSDSGGARDDAARVAEEG